MAKPWAKYEVGFINHDKFIALSANAIALWVEGKNYCDENHTDGMLPTYIVKRFRFYSKRSVELLSTSCGLKPGTDQPYGPLWEAHSVGFKMHDYLDHNDCREVVLDRKAGIEIRKAIKAEKQKVYRAKKRAEEEAELAALRSGNVPRNANGTEAERSENVTTAFCPTPEAAPTPASTPASTAAPASVIAKDPERKSLSLRSATTLEPEDIAERAGRLVERYGELFIEHRGGARYRPRPHLDWQEACDLCRVWTDKRLEKLAILVLTTDDPWISKTDRSFKIFAMKASWADQRLTDWEAAQVSA